MGSERQCRRSGVRRLPERAEACRRKRSGPCRSPRNGEQPHLRADWHLERIDEPVPPPADREQPSPRSLEEPGPRIGTLLDRAIPPAEERSRREHVRCERPPRTVLARVLECVDEGVAHRPRRRELE